MPMSISATSGLLNLEIPKNKKMPIILNEALVAEQYQNKYCLLKYNDERLERYQNFNRYYKIIQDSELTAINPYVLITRPSLNLVTNENDLKSPDVSNDPFFSYLWRENKNLVFSLTAEGLSGHDFIPFLLDRVESFQTSNFEIKNFAHQQPYTNYQIAYGSHAIESTTAVNFDITFREDKDLSVTKFFYAWLYYIDAVNRNILSPEEVNIKEKILDYASSVYYIACGPDGETILYFTKITGIFPVSVPLSNWSFNKGGGAPDSKISISFVGSFVESWNPMLLQDFNKNAIHVTETSIAGNSTSILRDAKYVPHYNKQSRTGLPIVGAPFITSENSSYKLRWRVPEL